MIALFEIVSILEYDDMIRMDHIPSCKYFSIFDAF